MGYEIVIFGIYFKFIIYSKFNRIKKKLDTLHYYFYIISVFILKA